MASASCHAQNPIAPVGTFLEALTRSALGGGNVPQVAATNLSKYNAHHIPQIFFCNFLQRSETTTPQAVFPYATKPSQTVGIEYTNSKMRLIHTDTSILYVAAEVC